MNTRRKLVEYFGTASHKLSDSVLLSILVKLHALYYHHCSPEELPSMNSLIPFTPEGEIGSLGKLGPLKITATYSTDCWLLQKCLMCAKRERQRQRQTEKDKKRQRKREFPLTSSFDFSPFFFFFYYFPYTHFPRFSKLDP